MSSEKLTRAVGRRLVALPIGTQRAGSRIHTYRPARRISLLREPFKPVAGACNSMPKPTFSADRKEPHPIAIGPDFRPISRTRRGRRTKGSPKTFQQSRHMTFIHLEATSCRNCSTTLRPSVSRWKPSRRTPQPFRCVTPSRRSPAAPSRVVTRESCSKAQLQVGGGRRRYSLYRPAPLPHVEPIHMNIWHHRAVFRGRQPRIATTVQN